jgi:hypothetical protein
VPSTVGVVTATVVPLAVTTAALLDVYDMYAELIWRSTPVESVP